MHQPWKPRNSWSSQPRFFFSLRGGASEPVGRCTTAGLRYHLNSRVILAIILPYRFTERSLSRKSNCFRTSFGDWDQKFLDQNSRFIWTTQSFTSSIAKNRATQIVWDVYNEILVGWKSCTTCTTCYFFHPFYDLNNQDERITAELGTPRRINMEPNNYPIEKKNHLF